MRAFIGVPAANFLAPRLIGNRLNGVKRGVAKTMLNVCVTSPITSAIIAALFSDPDDFASAYVAALSTTMPMTMFASFFIVGPVVKLLYHNRITPTRSMRILQAMKHCTPALSRLLGM